VRDDPEVDAVIDGEALELGQELRDVFGLGHRLRPLKTVLASIASKADGKPGMAFLLPDCPKGCRRTYEHLQSEVERAEIMADERLGIVLERL
jgi:hypothetical protein